MSHVTLASRIVTGACGALIIGTAAFAQTPTPAPAPPAQSPLGIPLTSTITTPGYPPAGPADPKLRELETPAGKKIHVLPATLETTQWGWFVNSQPPVLRVHSGAALVLETMIHGHTQVA